jgi:CBS domain containing-hemolysin-like protein
MAPKTLAIRKAESTVLWTAIPMWLFFTATYPLIWLLNNSANLLLRLVGIAPASEHELAHDENELRLLLASAAGGRISAQKRNLLDNIFELSHRFARQVMVPRGDVVYLSTDLSLEQNLNRARQNGHTRFPLCDGDLDHVFAMVHIKDLFRITEPLESLRDVSRPIALVPETLALDRLLKRMRTERLHFAAVLDEYGGVSGIVTLENVLEEIVGDIQDEFDAERPEMVRQEENVYQVSGAVLIVELEASLGVEVSERDEDTLGGVVLSELGRLPEVGDSVTFGPLDIEVLEVTGNRIRQLRVEVRRPKPAED